MRNDRKFENSLPDIRNKKPIKFSKFVVHAKINKNIKFFSPPNSPKVDSKNNFSMLSEKYKEIKNHSQECEIKINHLHNEITNSDSSDEKKLATLCLEMIDSAFM